jgi:hypothetical protein
VEEEDADKREVDFEADEDEDEAEEKTDEMSLRSVSGE